MKEKILAELKKKYSGLSNELLGLIADRMALKITAEDQIQGGITELENSPISISDYANFLQREGDRRVSEATKTHERTLREKFEFKEKAEPGPMPTPGNDDVKKQLELLNKKLQDMEQKEQKQLLQDKFIKKLTEKKIPLAFARGRVVESEDQIDAIVSEAENDFNEVKQSAVNEGLATNTLPIGSNGRKDDVDADITAWAGGDKK